MSEEAGGNQLEDIRVSFTADLSKLDQEIHKFTGELAGKLKPITEEVSKAILGPLSEMLPALQKIIDGLNGAKKDFETTAKNMSGAFGSAFNSGMDAAGKEATAKMRAHTANMKKLIKELEDARANSEIRHRDNTTPIKAELQALEDLKKGLIELKNEKRNANLFEDKASLAEYNRKLMGVTDTIDKLKNRIRELDQVSTGKLTDKLGGLSASARKDVEGISDALERNLKFFERYKRGLESASRASANAAFKQGILDEINEVDRQLNTAKNRWEKQVGEGIIKSISKMFASGLAKDATATGRAFSAAAALEELNRQAKQKGVNSTAIVKFRAELESNSLKAGVDAVVKDIKKLGAAKLLDNSSLDTALTKLNQFSSLFNRMGDSIQKDTASAVALGNAIALVAEKQATLNAERNKRVATADMDDKILRSAEETRTDKRLNNVHGLLRVANRAIGFENELSNTDKTSESYKKLRVHVAHLRKELEGMYEAIKNDDRARAFFEKFNQIQAEFKNVINLPMSSDQRRSQLDELAKRVDVLKTKFGEASAEAQTLDKFIGQIGAQRAGTYREQEREDNQEQVKQERIQRKKEQAEQRRRAADFGSKVDSVIGDVNQDRQRTRTLVEQEERLLSAIGRISDLHHVEGTTDAEKARLSKVTGDLRGRLVSTQKQMADKGITSSADSALVSAVHEDILSAPNIETELGRKMQAFYDRIDGALSRKYKFATDAIRQKLNKLLELRGVVPDDKLDAEIRKTEQYMFKSKVQDIEGEYKLARANLAPGQTDERNRVKDDAVEKLMQLRSEFKGTEKEALAFQNTIYKVLAQIAHDASREIGLVDKEFLDLNGILKRFHDAIMAAGNDQTKQLEAYKTFRGELEAVRNALGGNAEAQQKLIQMMVGAGKAIGGLTEGSMKQHISMLQQQYQLDMQEARSVADKRKVYENFIKTLDLIAPAYIGAVHGAEAFFNKEKAGAERLKTSQLRAQRGDLMNAVMNVGMMTGGSGVFIKESTDKYAEFSQSMANVNSIMKVSKEEIAGLSSSVMSLSNDPHITKGPTDLAKGLYDVASAGFTGEKAMEILAAASRGATAGLTDTHTVANLLSSTMRAFDYENMNASQQMDIMFKTVDKGILTFEQLAQHMGPVIQSAAMLKIPMQEVGAAISVLTRRGLQPAEAFTALNNVLLGLNSPTKEVTEEARKMGIQWLEAEKAAVHIKEVGLVEALRELSEATGGSTEKLQLLLPSMREIRGAAALLADGGYELIQMNLDFAQSLGSTDAALQKQSEGFKHHIEKMHSAWERFMISIGENNMILGLTDSLTGLINLMNSFPDWIKGGIGLTAGIAALGGTATAVGLVVQQLGTMTELLRKESGVAGALGRFGGWVSSIKGPLGVLSAVLAMVGLNVSVYNSEIARADELSKQWIDDQKKATEEARKMVTALDQKIKAFEKLKDMLKEYSKAADGSAEKSKLMENIMGRLSAIAPDLWFQIRQGSLAFDDLAKEGGPLDNAINKLKEYMRVNKDAAASNFNDNDSVAKAGSAVQAAKDRVKKYDEAVALLKTLQVGAYNTTMRAPIDGRVLVGAQWQQVHDPEIVKHLKSFGVTFNDGIMTVRSVGPNQKDIDARLEAQRKIVKDAVPAAELAKIKAVADEYAQRHKDDPGAVRKYYKDAGIPQHTPDFAKEHDPQGTISQQKRDMDNAFKGTISKSQADAAGLSEEYVGQSISVMLDAVNKQKHRHSDDKNAALDRLKDAWEKLLSQAIKDVPRARTGQSFDNAYQEHLKPFQHEYVDDKTKKPRASSGGRDYEEVTRALADLIDKNDSITFERRRELMQTLGDLHKRRVPLPAIQETGDLGMSQALSFLTNQTPNASGSVGRLVGTAMSELEGHPELKGKILSAAKNAGIDPRVFSTLLFTESSFNPRAVGPVTDSGERALGIGQIMPGTGSPYGLKTQADFFNVDKALPASADILRNAIASYTSAGVPPQEAVKFALAAYNAGPGAPGIRRGVHHAWQRAGMSKTFADVAPFLPKETQDYVEAIAGNSSAKPAQITGLTGVPMISGKSATGAQISATQAFINNKMQNMRRYTEVVADLDKGMSEWMEELAATGVTPTKLEQLNEYDKRVVDMRKKDPDAYRSLMGTASGQTAHSAKRSTYQREAANESVRFMLEADKERVTAERAVKQDRLAVLEDTHNEEMAAFDKETERRKKGFSYDTPAEKLKRDKFDADRAAIRLAKETVYQETRIKLIEDSEQRILDIEASVAERRAQITGDSAADLLAIEKKYAADLNKINVEERLAINTESDPGRKQKIRDNAVENRRMLFLAKEQNRRAKSGDVNEAGISILEDMGLHGASTKDHLKTMMGATSDIMRSTFTTMLSDTDSFWTKWLKIADGAFNKFSEMLMNIGSKVVEDKIGKYVLSTMNEADQAAYGGSQSSSTGATKWFDPSLTQPLNVTSPFGTQGTVSPGAAQGAEPAANKTDSSGWLNTAVAATGLVVGGAKLIGDLVNDADPMRQRIEDNKAVVGDVKGMRDKARWNSMLKYAGNGSLVGGSTGALGGAAVGTWVLPGLGTAAGAAIGGIGGTVVGGALGAAYGNSDQGSEGEFQRLMAESTKAKMEQASAAASFIGQDAANSKVMSELNRQLNAYADIVEHSTKGSENYNNAIAGLSTTVKAMDEQTRKAATDTAANNLAIAAAGGGQQYINAAAEARYGAERKIAYQDLDKARANNDQKAIEAAAAKIVTLDREEQMRKSKEDARAVDAKRSIIFGLNQAGMMTNQEYAQANIGIEQGRSSKLQQAIETAITNGTNVTFEGVSMTVDQAKDSLVGLSRYVTHLVNQKFLDSPEFQRDIKKNFYENVSSSNTMNLQQMMGNKRLSLLADANYAVEMMDIAKKSGIEQDQVKASQDFIKSIKDIQNTAFEQATQEFKQSADAATAVASDKLKGIDREITMAERNGQTISTDMVNRRVAATRESIAAQGQLLRTEMTRLNLTADEKKKMEADLHSLEMDYINAESDARLEAGKKWIDQRVHALDLERQHLDYLKGTSQISEDQAMFSSTGTNNLFGPQGITVRQGALAQAVINEGLSTGNKELQAQGEGMYTKAVGEFWDYLSKTQGTMKYTANEEFKKLVGAITVPTAELKAILDPDNADKNATSWDTATKPVATYADRVKEIGNNLISLTGLSDPMQKALSAAFNKITNGSLAEMIKSLQDAIGLTDTLRTGRSSKTSSSGGSSGTAADGGPLGNYTAIQGNAAMGGVGSQDTRGGSVSIQDGHYVYTDVNGNSRAFQYGGVAGYADGGIIRNPFIGGPPNSFDTVPAWLTPGEEVKTRKDPFHVANLASTAMLMAQKIGSMIRHESKSVAITVSGNYLHPDMDMGRFAQQLADELTFKGIL